MSETVAPMREEAEKPAVGKEELASALEVLQVMLKTSKGFRMYLANNPLLGRFVEELMSRTAGHFAQYGEYRLDVDQFQLHYKGNSIYENRDPKESLAFKMYSDGIRSLIFSEGVEQGEMCDFLDIVGRDSPTDLDDDIVTLLWMKDLSNITYVLAEDTFNFDAAGGGAGSPASQGERIASVYEASLPASAPLLVPQQILTLTEAETDWLKKARDTDEARNPLDEVISILSAILLAEKSPEDFGEFVEIVGNLIGNLVHSGDIRHALTLAGFMRDLAGNEALPPANREKAARAMEGRLSEGLVRALKETIDTTDKITPEELRKLLQLFGVSAIKPMCELLGVVEKMKMRKAIIDTLAEVGRDAPEAFLPFLSDSRWFLVRNMLHVLARIGSPKGVEAAGRLIGHPEPRVRREVLQYIERTPDARAKSAVMKFLQDESSAIRIRALQVLAGSRVAAALRPIAAMAQAKDFEGREISEKKAVFEALGELGGDQVVPMLRSMLIKKYWFNREKERDAVICAVAGLRKAGTAEALRVLQEAAATKKDEARRIVENALRGLTADRARAAAGP